MVLLQVVTISSPLWRQALHMEANVEPKQDPDLKIEWFLNGKVLEQAHRYKTTYDFGLVTLDLNDAYDRDQGIYTCRAFNKVCANKITSQFLDAYILSKYLLRLLHMTNTIIFFLFHVCRLARPSALPLLLWAVRTPSLRVHSILPVKQVLTLSR